MRNLYESAALCDLKLHPIVLDKWEGYYDKIKYIIDAIRVLPDDDIVCFVDSFDVIAFASEEEIVERFLEYDRDLVVSGERDCFPESYREEHPKLYEYNNFVNSGGYIGYKRAIWEMFHWKPQEEIKQTCTEGGDGLYFMKYYTAFYMTNKITMDNAQLIFQTMFTVPWRDCFIQNKRFYNRRRGTKPCFVHFNGGSHATIEKHGKEGESVLSITVANMKKSVLTNDSLEYDTSLVPMFIWLEQSDTRSTQQYFATR